MAIHQEERPTRGPLTSVDAAVGIARNGRSPVADMMSPLLAAMLGAEPPVRFVFWDGSVLGPEGGPGAVVLNSPRALTRLLWSPDELGMARSFIAGDIDLDGQIYELLRTLHVASGGKYRFNFREATRGLRAVFRLGAVHRPPPRPAEEVHLVGRRHSKSRDASAISHHYDVSNDFYRLMLGPAMTYSCARFGRDDMSLEEAQRSKIDLVCRKLGLHEHPGARLLDVGCGWGSLAIYAAKNFGAQVVAITLSAAQAEFARSRVSDAGLEGLVDVRLQDYRDLHGETFDAISSIGMFEHVGTRRTSEYFGTLFSLLAPEGRLLNHAISTPGGSKVHGRTFMNRYVFPDGELIDVADVVGAMERTGFEVRDVESLREHYNKTLRAWVTNLETSWDEATELVGEGRARVWRLYMAASANGFEDAGLAIHQVLGVRATQQGSSGMPLTRAGWD